METVPTSEITRTVSRYVSNSGMYFLHPFDDLDLIAGCARCECHVKLLYNPMPYSV